MNSCNGKRAPCAFFIPRSLLTLLLQRNASNSRLHHKSPNQLYGRYSPAHLAPPPLEPQLRGRSASAGAQFKNDLSYMKKIFK